MSFTVLPAAAPERQSLHHAAAPRTALALALALCPAAARACPQCAASPTDGAAPLALLALSLAPVLILAAVALWIARVAHRSAEVE
jgi:hypothetical protein